MSEIAGFINAQYDKRAALARAALVGPGIGVDLYEGTAESRRAYRGLLDAYDEDWVLADIESKRQVIREVMSWRHDVVEGDCWFTCGAATEERDGGECCNDDQRNECTCGLDVRRMKILSLLAAPFSGEPDYDAERWAV